MKTVQILESSDTILPTDWCRPLCITSMSGDFYSFKSQYSGVPENNAMWVRVQCVIGKCWHNKTINELEKAGLTPYEFVRGDIPDSHKLNMNGYVDISEFQ